MASPDPDQRARAAVVLAVAVALVASPARVIWARPEAPWWLPFALWGGLCVGGAWLAAREAGRRRGAVHDDE